MTKGVRCSPKWLRRGARVIMCALEDSRTGLISVTRHICKSVAQISRHLRPDGVRRRRLRLAPPMTGAGVKFNALGINRFAMKRPFAAVITFCGSGYGYMYGALHKNRRGATVGVAAGCT